MHTPFLSRTGSPVSLSTFIKVTGYSMGAILVVKPTAPTVLSMFTETEIIRGFVILNKSEIMGRGVLLCYSIYTLLSRAVSLEPHSELQWLTWNDMNSRELF